LNYRSLGHAPLGAYGKKHFSRPSRLMNADSSEKFYRH
jgi:hypothetical protein